MTGEGGLDILLPVIKFEAWPPVRRLEESEESAGDVDEAITHQEEHTEHQR